MKKDILNEPLYCERSYIKSLVAGIRLPLRHPFGFLRHLWPLMLFTVCVWALVSGCVATQLWYFHTLATQPGLSPSSLIGLPLLRVMAWGGLVAVLYSLQVGQLHFLMLRYGTLTYLPAVHPWHVWRSILPCVLRSTACGVGGYIVWCLFALFSLFVMPTRMWALVSFFILSLVWIVLFTTLCQHYLLSGSPFWPSLKAAFRSHDGMDSSGRIVHYPSRLGGTASLLVVCGLVCLLVILAGQLPAVCTLYVGGISDHTIALGDVSDLPAIFPWLRAFSFGLGALVAFLTLPFLLVPLVFHWGAGGYVRESTAPGGHVRANTISEE